MNASKATASGDGASFDRDFARDLALNRQRTYDLCARALTHWIATGNVPGRIMRWEEK